MSAHRILFTEKQVAEILNLSLGKLRKDRFYNRGLPYIRMGRSIRYEEQAIYQCINDNRINPRMMSYNCAPCHYPKPQDALT